MLIPEVVQGYARLHPQFPGSGGSQLAVRSIVLATNETKSRPGLRFAGPGVDLESDRNAIVDFPEASDTTASIVLLVCGDPFAGCFLRGGAAARAVA